MKNLDITMTSILRPEVVKNTLESLKGHLKFSGEIRLILSIDPIGERVKQKEIYKIARSYYPVLHKYNERASFEDAVLWLWNQITAPYTLHWEDDKVLLKDLDMDWCIKKLEENKQIAAMSFPTLKIKKKERIFCYCNYKLENEIYITDEYGQCFGTRPHLIRKDFITSSLPYIHNRRNIEKQFRYSNGKFCENVLSKWIFALYPESEIYRDYGNDWKKKMKLKKDRGKTHKYIEVIDNKFDSHNY